MINTCRTALKVDCCMMSLRVKSIIQINLGIEVYNISPMTDTTNESQDAFEAVKKHITKYTKPQDVQAWIGLGVTLAIELLAIYLIYSGHNLLGWIVHGFNIIRIFVQFHDMAHYSYFSTITMNKIVGAFFGIYVHFPFNAWRDGHNHHHRHFGNLDRLDLSQSILFTKKQYDSFSPKIRILVRILREPVIYFFVVLPFIWFIGLTGVIIMRYGVFSKTFLQKIISLTLYIYVLPKLGVPIVGLWVSIYIGEAIGTIIFHLQHGVNLPYRSRKQKWDAARAALEGSTFLEVHPLLKPFMNGIQYHHIHHLNTNVASYAMRKCHEEFQKSPTDFKHWQSYNVNKVPFGLALKSIMNVMMDEQKNQLVPFDYKFW